MRRQMAKHLGEIATQSYLAGRQWGETGGRRHFLLCKFSKDNMLLDVIKQGWYLDQLYLVNIYYVPIPEWDAFLCIILCNAHKNQ